MYTEETYRRAWGLLEAKARAGHAVLEMDVTNALDLAEEFEDQVRERARAPTLVARISGFFRRRGTRELELGRPSERPTSPPGLAAFPLAPEEDGRIVQMVDDEGIVRRLDGGSLEGGAAPASE